MFESGSFLFTGTGADVLFPAMNAVQASVLVLFA